MFGDGIGDVNICLIEGSLLAFNGLKCGGNTLMTRFQVSEEIIDVAANALYKKALEFLFNDEAELSSVHEFRRLGIEVGSNIGEVGIEVG